MTHPSWARLSGLAICAVLVLGSPTAGQGQEGRVERAGDLIMMGLPVTSLATTLALEDYDGTGEFFLGFGVTAAVTEGLKRLVPTDRPDLSDDESFPSGHTSIAFHSAAFIHLRYGLRYGAPAYAAAAFVGYSRVEARKHRIVDVLVGLAIGTVSAKAFTDRRMDDASTADTMGMAFGVRSRFGSGMATRFSGGLLGIVP